MTAQPFATRFWLVTAALSLATYPLLRPWGPEEGAGWAQDLASTAWPVAHSFGMLGFVAIALALRSAAHSIPWPWTGRPLREAETRAWLAVALLLPYYGAEAYGLHALGRHATEQGQYDVLAAAELFRFAPLPVTTFALGLLALVLVGARLAHGVWRTGILGRTGGLLAGLGLATYLPQFFGPAGLRITHGLVLGVGLVLVAVAARRPSSRADAGRTEVQAMREIEMNAS